MAIILMITMMLSYVALAENTSYDTARSVANFMEDHYEESLGQWDSNQSPDDRFAQYYGMVNEVEDRATIIEAYLYKDDAWWESRPHLEQKLEKMMGAVVPVFGENVYGGGE